MFSFSDLTCFGAASSLTEHGAASADGDGLALGVVGKGSLTKLAADTRLLEATEGQGGVEPVVAVDPDGTSLEGVGDADGGVDVLGVDGGGETVAGVVAEGDDLSLVLELGDGADGAENLLLHDLHVGADVGEDGGLDEVALVAVAVATNLDSSALLLTGLDVAHDAVELELGDLGTLEGVGSEGVADLVLEGAGLEGLEELVVDVLLDEDTGTGAAALAVVEVDTEVDPRDGSLDVSIAEDNVRGLATKLESDFLEVGGSGGLHDGAAHNGGSGESDLVDIHVRSDSGTGSLAETGKKVEDTRGETSLLDELGEDKGRERGLLSSLHDDNVTGSQGGANLPGKHQKREVPGDNLTADTNLEIIVSKRNSSSRSSSTHGLLAGVGEHLRVDVNGLALDLVGPSTVVADAGGDGTDVTLGHGDGLAVVEGLDGGEGLDVALNEVSKLQQELGADSGGSGAPLALKGLAGSCDGNVDILLGGFADGGDDLLSGGVDDLKLLLVNTLNPLVVDEPDACC